MEKKRPLILILTGMFAIGLGAAIMFPNYYFVLDQFLNYSELVARAGFLTWLHAVAYSVGMSVSLILGGIGLLFFKRWSRYLLIFCLAAELLYRFAEHLPFWLYCVQDRRLPLFDPRLGANVMQSYFIILIEIIALYYLTSSGVEEQFK